MAKKQYKQKRTQYRKKRSSKKGFSKKKLIALLLFFVAISIGAFVIYKIVRGEPNKFESDKYFVKGIDVSHHNPILNWEEVLAQNITFAYLKATEGNTHLDRNYIYNYDLAKAATIKVGSYHFYTFALSGKEQAQHFIKTANCKSGDMIPAIDVEHSKANPYSEDKDYTALVVKELQVLEDELYKYYGVRPIIYTNRDCYKLYVKDYFPENIIWMCDLHKEPSDEIANWKIWQFSHKGKIQGVLDDIDLNYYRYSFQQFKELLLP